MKITKWLLGLILMAGLFTACKKEKVDTEPPAIDISDANAFPKQCSEIKRGESFIVKVKLTDNQALGTYSIDVHHNFDRHTHSTDAEECVLDAVKTPVKPFLFIRSYDIPSQQKSYETHVEIVVPSDIDLGDYHFMIQATDTEGWSAIRRLSVRIV